MESVALRSEATMSVDDILFGIKMAKTHQHQKLEKKKSNGAVTIVIITTWYEIKERHQLSQEIINTRVLK